MDNLISFFNNYLPLNDAEKNALSKIVVSRSIKKNHYILQKHDICNHYTFILEGITRSYAIHLNGTENNLKFATENQLIVDLDSFHSAKPSAIYIESMEPSKILQIEKSNLLELFTKFPKFDRIFRVIIENEYIQLEKRIIHNISIKAEDRYQEFLNEFPKLASRIPNTHIASYLGITPEFLSKIRKNISTKC
jgi:CRP-like cAMP-binding protein